MTHSRTGFGNRLVGWLSTILTVVFAVLWPVAAGAQAVPKADFDIPPQRLEAALQQVAQVQRVQILFNESDVKGLDTSGVKGKLSTYEAVQKLIEGTGLSAVANQNNAIAIRPKSANEKGGQAANPTLLAQAQNAERPGTRSTQDQPSSSDPVRGEGIVVTAQKRSELLIDVPQSITVLSADHLAKIGATQFRDFADTVPGLSFQTEGAGLTQITLRGVTTGKDGSATVGIYVDEVPYGSSSPFARGSHITLDTALFDMDRIEVLRGPQGTLYGASTMGGLIKYVTKKPDVTRFGVDAQTGLSHTRHGEMSYHGAATVNAPLVSDRMAVRATAFYSRDGGYIDNLSLDQEDVNRSSIHGGRADLLFTPTARFAIRLTGFLQNISRDGFPLADFSLAGVPLNGILEQRNPLGESFEQRFRLVSGTVNYDLDWATLTSVSSYQTIRGRFAGDTGAVAFCALVNRTCSAFGFLDTQATDKYTQEVRLASEGTKALEWLIGGFYTRENSDRSQDFVSRDEAGQPRPFAIATDIFTFSSPSRFEESAAFGNLTWRPIDKFSVGGGVRYAVSRQNYTQHGGGAFGRSAPLTSTDDAVATYLANARYHLSDHATAYLRYATGYRPGGPNFVLDNPATGLPLFPSTFEADSLKSYEVGFKGETSDRRFGIDLGTYQIDWSNIQVLISRGGFSAWANASGGARIRGAELALTARPISAFTMTGSLSYQDAKLLDAQPDLRAARGERLPTVPRVTAALNADYQLGMGNLRPTVGATVRYVDDRPGSFGSPAYRLPSYTTVDLRAGLALSRINVQLYVRNLLDERGQLAGRAFSSISNLPAAVFPISIMQPRTVGLIVSTKF